MRSPLDFRLVMMGRMSLFSLAFLSIAVLSQTAARPSAEAVQATFAVDGTPASKSYDAFISHFSAIQEAGAPSLIHALRQLHPTSAFVATQAPEFDLVKFTSASANNASFTKVAAPDHVFLRQFAPPARRIDGLGTLVDKSIFGVFDLTWNGREFRIYSAEWREGFGQARQHHIVAETEEEADLLVLAVSTFSTSLHEAILVFDQSHWTPDHQLWQSIQKASWKDVILSDKLKNAVQHEYLSFFKSEKIYKDLGVPWKRGIIFLGPPGNGKTISLKAIMKLSGVPSLYVKSFHTYGGDELGIRMIFQRARAEAPCILILEDLDSLITDQNRSFFLNEVDGLEDNDGLLLIGTTNHFDRLDPALSNRPSRFDRKYTFPDPNRAERREYAVYWQHKLRDAPLVDFPDSLLDEVAKGTHGFSFAYLKEAFVAALITLASDESDPPLEFGKTLLEQIDWLKGQLGNDDVVPPTTRWLNAEPRFGKAAKVTTQKKTCAMNMLGYMGQKQVAPRGGRMAEVDADERPHVEATPWPRQVW